jgi:glyoxylase-like metal-dependent hydrolase (beta-lactamase superfamily II)
VRDSENLLIETGATVWMNEKDAVHVEFGIDRMFTHGARLAGGFEAIEIPDSNSPGESAFLLRDRKCLILGDALIGKPAGQLNLPPPDKLKNPRKAKEGIRVLLDYPFDVVLVGDGTSILQGGRKAVEAFLERS